MRIYIIAFIAFCCIGFGAFWYTYNTIEAESLAVTPEGAALNPEVEKSEGGSLSEFVVSEETDLSSFEKEGDFYKLDWNMLSKIDFEERYNDSIADYIYYPIFHPSLKVLNRQPVIIKGYIIPFEETGSEQVLILSAFPFTNCFFCGNAGPESVMDVKLRPNHPRKKFKQDAVTTFKGTLRLNDTDLYYLNYILEDAEVVE
ncbi:MAG: hypothetical protein KDC44_20320 [Phaeodactylibacter sp.]|nr:hypothetical protein [Phaeodactylibacter sp.]